MSQDNTEQEIFKDLILFIRNQTREYKKSITRETLLENDLGITGEEASELLRSFSQRFDVDIGRFEFGKYFNEEPNVFMDSRKISPLTIGHLEKAVRARRLDEDIIND